MKQPLALTLLLTNFLVTGYFCSGQSRTLYGDCTEMINDQGIRVSSCLNKDSRFRSIMAEFDLNVSTEVITAALFNIPAYTEWQYKTIKATVVERVSDDEMIYYVEIASPWPFNNRDIIAHLRKESCKDGNGIRLVYNGKPDYLPEKNGLTRVRSSASEFRIAAIAENKVHITFFSTVDPSGHVPAWMMNLVSCEGPFISFSRLKARLEAEVR
jgi:hypothetical protein